MTPHASSAFAFVPRTVTIHAAVGTLRNGTERRTLS